MRKMTVLGASALLVAGLMVSPAAAFAAPVAGAPVATTPDTGATCVPKEGEEKVEVPSDPEQTSIPVTADSGFVIVGYCVKAGSGQQEEGPEFEKFDPPVTEVTITHSSGKGISHYIVYYEPVTEPTPSPTPTVPSDEPTEEPSGTPEPSALPGDESSEPTVAPTGDTTEPSAEAGVAEGDEPPVLAATGASTAIGFTLIALALVGGGVTLLVLRRKGVLGS